MENYLGGKQCACGREHDIAIDDVIVGNGVISQLPDIIARYNAKKPFILADVNTFAAAGKGVQKGAIEEMNIRDLSAIVLYALGIDAPAFDEQGWTAQVPAGIFADAVLPEYRDISHLTGAAPRRSKVAHTSELI